MQKQKAPWRIVFQQFPTPSCKSTPFYILFTSGELSCEYATVLVTLINLTDKGWDKIHSICLMWHLIESNVNSTPSSMMKPVCNIDLSYAS